ncbi:WD repeat-containing protein 17 [Bagarius yarrelli]|uniref:WD repeat-containing protein 17 n=1 Tax=Bagarius yarrelli TaxID=175774 RepID=A0A556V6V9_BAGYA|nr:WD repeat-containing protein 17 [Bagarius yarrelli]
MATGDVKGSLRKLQSFLRTVKYPRDVDYQGLAKGDPSCCLPIVSYAFTSFSTAVAEHLVERGIELTGKNDLSFMESVYKVLRDFFSYKPMLTKQQFLQFGFAERKIALLCDIINFVLDKQKQLTKGSKACFGKRLSRTDSRSVDFSPPKETQRTTRQIVSSRSLVERHPSLRSPANSSFSSDDQQLQEDRDEERRLRSQDQDVPRPSAHTEECVSGGRLQALEAGLKQCVGRLEQQLSMLDTRVQALERSTAGKICIERSAWEELENRVLLLETGLTLTRKQGSMRTGGAMSEEKRQLCDESLVLEWVTEPVNGSTAVHQTLPVNQVSSSSSEENIKERLERIASINGYSMDLDLLMEMFDPEGFTLQARVKMSQVKQVGLLAAGCQPWNKDVCVASGDRFAYCATLAIYVYQLDHRYNEFKLRAIMSEHKKTITAISWCPHNPEVFASASADNLLIIWNVAEQKAVARLDNTKGIPASISWCWNTGESVAFVSHRGPLYVWVISGPDSGVTVHKEAHSFLSDICLFRWHPVKKGKVVFGHTDGSLSIFQPGSKNQKHVLRPESLEGTDEEDPVTALEWDPLSTDYLLVANMHNGIRLLDTDSLSCVTAFSLPSAAACVQCLAWVPTAPGMFITGDSQVGVLRVWNVSRTTPLDNFKLKKTGFHALHVLNSPPAKKVTSSISPSKNHYTSSTSEAVPPPTLSQNQAFSLPPGHAVCCFMDGGVGLYDMGAKKWDFLRDLGHVETIFDCKFKPDDPNLLATASFDGTIKVWDINTLTAVYTSPGNEGVIYSLSWAPGDLNCIAGATSRNGAFIWDVKKGKMITRFNEHGKNGIFCIAWSHKDSKRIATCSGDGFCIIRTIDGKLLHKYKHPAAVFGDMIATGCEDKNVRVYYLATSSDQPLKVFTGHTAKVFHVRWSPLREGILCSGSDDGTVRIWDYTQDACINVLSGHTAPVRGLMWNSEVPYLLTSGSWDYTIRVWDTRDGTCLDTVYDHGADVYGTKHRLTCHPSRPFTMASCSRDSTVRLWSLTPLIAPLLINILTEHSWDDIIGNTDRAMVPGAPPLLCGKVSRDIKQELDKLSSDVRTKKLRWFSECFSPPGGSHNLWDLVAVINGQDDSLLPQNYGQGIMHMKHLVRFKTISGKLNQVFHPGLQLSSVATVILAVWSVSLCTV